MLSLKDDKKESFSLFIGEDEYKNNGRPSGSGTAEQQIKEWQAANPGKKKADCHRETGLDPKTIRKWWNEIN